MQARRRQAGGRRPAEAILFDRRPRVLPALGYIPAGLPYGAVEQQCDQFLVVPDEKYPDAEFALKVHGDSMVDADIHHGDWVLMSTRLSPRNGSVVAALCEQRDVPENLRDRPAGRPLPAFGEQGLPAAHRAEVRDAGARGHGGQTAARR